MAGPGGSETSPVRAQSVARAIAGSVGEEGTVEEVAHERCDDVELVLKREMPGIEQM